MPLATSRAAKLRQSMCLSTRSMVSHSFIFGPGDHLVLDRLADLDPVLGKAGDANHQAAIVVGVLLGIAEQFAVYHVVLDMEAALAHVGLGQRQQLLATLCAPYGGGMQLQVHLGVLRKGVVPYRCRFE